MSYAVGHAFNMHDMFMNFPYEKLEMSCNDCERINKDPHRDHLVKKIFRACVKEILNDVVDNNVTFNLPTEPRHVYIHVRRSFGEEFKWARRHGKWNDVDFLKSNFSGNQLSLNMGGMYAHKGKPIYVDKRLKQKLTDNTNLGKQYC